MNFILSIWRQASPEAKGKMVKYKMSKVSEETSLLEMLDMLNEKLTLKDEEPVAFDSDCREGICGSCSLVVNGRAHGPGKLTTSCQVFMRSFTDGQTIHLEPYRSAALPVIKDLVVDRTSLDRIIQSGGYISAHSGPKPEPNSVPIGYDELEESMDAAACIGCGACAAACPNGSAMLFTAAKIGHLGLLPQGQPERSSRAKAMVQQMDDEGFGACTNYAECQDACPKGISIKFIGRMNKDFAKAMLCDELDPRGSMDAN